MIRKNKGSAWDPRPRRKETVQRLARVEILDLLDHLLCRYVRVVDQLPQWMNLAQRDEIQPGFPANCKPIA